MPRGVVSSRRRVDKRTQRPAQNAVIAGAMAGLRRRVRVTGGGRFTDCAPKDTPLAVGDNPVLAQDRRAFAQNARQNGSSRSGVVGQEWALTCRRPNDPVGGMGKARSRIVPT